MKPETAKIPAWENPFGVSFGEVFSGENFMDDIRALGIKRTKILLWWGDIEPAGNGLYYWELLDTFLDQLEDGDIALLTIFSTGPHTTGQYNKGSPILDYDAYHEFILSLVKHCSGKVQYFQRDTEPFCGGPHWPVEAIQEYIEAQRVFYNAVKTADPDASVIGVSHGGQLVNGMLRRYLPFRDVALAGYYDLADIRLYGNKYEIRECVLQFQEIVPDGIPIVCCEFGGPHLRETPNWSVWEDILRHYFFGADTAISFFTLPDTIMMFHANCSPELDALHEACHFRDIWQRHVIILSTGIRQMWYWNLQSDGTRFGFGKMRLGYFDGGEFIPRPIYHEYARMVDYLKNVDDVRRVSAPLGTWTYQLTYRDGSVKYITWNEEDDWTMNP
jgi:hypothetical protein